MISKLDAHKQRFAEDIMLGTQVENLNYPSEQQIPYEIVSAIAAQETGWGKGNLYIEGKNPFSLRANTNWKGRVWTPKYAPEREYFAFDTLQDSIKQLYKKVWTSPRYGFVREAITNYNKGKGSLEEIVNKWGEKVEGSEIHPNFAEDPEWIEKVLDVMNLRIRGTEKENLEYQMKRLTGDLSYYNEQ